MNPMYMKILLSLIRQAMKAGGLTGVAIGDDTITQAISGAIALAGFLWSLWKTYKEQQKLVVAAAAGAPISLDRVDQMVKAGQAPSVTTPTNEVPQLKRASDG